MGGFAIFWIIHLFVFVTLVFFEDPLHLGWSVVRWVWVLSSGAVITLISFCLVSRQWGLPRVGCSSSGISIVRSWSCFSERIGSPAVVVRKVFLKTFRRESW